MNYPAFNLFILWISIFAIFIKVKSSIKIRRIFELKIYNKLNTKSKEFIVENPAW